MNVLSPDDETFNRIPFADLDTLTDRELHALNAELAAGGGDLGRTEQWRARIAEILVDRS
jgi:hypothetical protein